MKRKWLPCAVSVVFSMSVQAQSTITLYGALDAGPMYQSSSAASFSPGSSNTGKVFRYKDGGIYGSKWGLLGSKDLGGGYRANFRLQTAFDSSNGKFGLGGAPGEVDEFGQYASVGVAGPFGQVNLGRQIVPMYYAMADTDVRGGRYFGSIFTAWIGANTAAGWAGASTNGPIGALYDSNAIIYESPSVGGATLSLEYAPGGVPGQLQGNTRESAVLRYAVGSLKLAAVYYNGHDTNPAPGQAATGVDNNRFVYVGALYTFHGFSVSASYGNGRNPARDNAVDIDLWSAGLGYRFSPFFQVTSAVYYLKDRNNGANESTAYAFGADYLLSKRTTLYGQLGVVKNKGNMTQAIAYGQPVAPGMSTTAAMLGIRHVF